MKKKIVIVVVIVVFLAGFVKIGSLFINHKLPIDDSREKDALTPMIRVDGVLYIYTGRLNTDELMCGTYDDRIASTVNRNEKPDKDNQSNFGTGYGYQCGKNNTMNVFIDGKCYIFAAEETK